MIHLVKRHKALFIDIDGTAVQSEPLIRVVVEEMALDGAIRLVPDDWKKLGGIGDKAVWAELCRRSSKFSKMYETGDAFEKERIRRYKEKIQKLEPYQPVLDLANQFLEAGREVFAVTNSPPDVAHMNLEMTGYPVSDIELISHEHAHAYGLQSKPAIGMYSLAYHMAGLNRLKKGNNRAFERSHCLICEDSRTAALGGLAERMHVIHFVDMNVPLTPEEFLPVTGRARRRSYMPMTFDSLAKMLGPCHK